MLDAAAGLPRSVAARTAAQQAAADGAHAHISAAKLAAWEATASACSTSHREQEGREGGGGGAPGLSVLHVEVNDTQAPKGVRSCNFKIFRER
jgi:hypothetical protein